MATFFSTSNDQRGLAGGGGGAGDMSFHHHYPMSNQYPDSSTGGLIPLPASIVQQSHIAHGGGGGDGRDDEQAAFMGSRDGSELGGLQTQMLMGDGGASAGQRSHQGGLSLSLGSQVPVSLYQYGRPGGMAAAASPTLMSPNQSAMAMAASRNAQVNVYVQNSRFLKAARELLDEVVSVRDAIKRKGDRKDDSAGNEHSKVDEAACSEDQDRDEFQSTSTHAGASQLLNAYKSEPVGSMDAGPLSSFGGGDMGTYAPAGLSLNHHGPGGGSLLQDAFPHHGDDTRFVPYGGNMGDLGGSVSLTLGLQHCNNNNNAGHVPPEQQGLLYGNPGDFDFLNGGDDRQRFASSSSQLLHDFVT
ncbi:unnamed protein product [Triticum turgidum subsp. durum]|uniref:POX domain-containing protein n=1 Tax=Triticum turgidum subsp. durum TaxID=4567 RepID=A0A9R0T8P6_TRITD|nr:unnamed protein product [Triticum turgidum subsp. durum]